MKRLIWNLADDGKWHFHYGKPETEEWLISILRAVGAIWYVEWIGN